MSVENIIERMLEVIDGSSLNDLANEVMTSPQNISSWKSRNKTPYAECELLAVKYNISMDWLIMGKYLPERADEAHEGYESVVQYDVAFGAGNSTLITKENKKGELLFKQTSLHKMGMNAKDLAAVQVKGDSMEPTLMDKATVIIDMTATRLVDGAIYCLTNGDESLVKRLQLDPLDHKMVSIISDNKLYPVVRCNLSEVRIVGKVVWYGQFLTRR